MIANPKGDWTIANIETMCKQVGLEFRKPTTGSHYKVFSRLLDTVYTIPAHKPVKTVYVRKITALAEMHRSSAKSEDEGG